MIESDNRDLKKNPNKSLEIEFSILNLPKDLPTQISEDSNPSSPVRFFPWIQNVSSKLNFGRRISYPNPCPDSTQQLCPQVRFTNIKKIMFNYSNTFNVILRDDRVKYYTNSSLFQMGY